MKKISLLANAAAMMQVSATAFANALPKPVNVGELLVAHRNEWSAQKPIRTRPAGRKASKGAKKASKKARTRSTIERLDMSDECEDMREAHRAIMKG